MEPGGGGGVSLRIQLGQDKRLRLGEAWISNYGHGGYFHFAGFLKKLCNCGLCGLKRSSCQPHGPSSIYSGEKGFVQLYTIIDIKYLPEIFHKQPDIILFLIVNKTN